MARGVYKTGVVDRRRGGGGRVRGQEHVRRLGRMSGNFIGIEEDI